MHLLEGGLVNIREAQIAKVKLHLYVIEPYTMMGKSENSY